jgi:branched-chain amino acid transport system substrate-binding protein
MVVDAVYTPPLLDATAIVQQLRDTHPDLLMSGTTAHTDTVTLLHAMHEWQIHVPTIGIGPQFTTRELRDSIGAERLEGLMATVASHTMPEQAELVQRFHKRTAEAWMTQDAVSAYAEIWIIKEAIEKAASADPSRVRQALATIDIASGPAAQALLPGRIRFDAQGRRLHATPVLVQWQGGVPYIIYPPEGATRQAVWPQ